MSYTSLSLGPFFFLSLAVFFESIPKLKFEPSLRPRPPLKLPFILVRDGEWRLPYEGMELPGGGAALSQRREQGDVEVLSRWIEHGE